MKYDTTTKEGIFRLELDNVVMLTKKHRHLNNINSTLFSARKIPLYIYEVHSIFRKINNESIIILLRVEICLFVFIH